MMGTVTAAAVAAVAGLAAGLFGWRWLRTGTYRTDHDSPRRTLGLCWVVVPMAGFGGAVAGLAPGWLIVPSWVYLIGGAVVVWIDLDVHRVPDRVLRWWMPALMVALLASAWGSGSWALLVGAAAGAGVMGAVFLVLAVVGSMGLGDVKLAAVSGLVLGAFGVSAVLTAVAVGFAGAALAGAWLLLRGAGRTAHLAFGPAIVLGSAAAVLLGAVGR